MPYRSTDKTRRKKDAKRAAMMQAALRVFAEKGYHAATIRDIVDAAGVAVGTFYFYFPDKETLFIRRRPSSCCKPSARRLLARPRWRDR
jgi:AcrR family transcriptional regulator